jgi:hypothetical protein
VLADHAEAVRDGLWKRLEDGKAPAGERLRAACGLASLDPDSPRWHKVSGDVVRLMLADNRLWLGDWVALLRPARRHLLDPLTVTYRDRTDRATQTLVADVLLDYAADRPDFLAGLLLDADEQQYPRLWARLQPHRAAVAARMEEELTTAATRRTARRALRPRPGAARGRGRGAR